MLFLGLERLVLLILIRRASDSMTLIIDKTLIKSAQKLTGIKDEKLLVEMGLEALIQRESAKRLAKLGGTEKDLEQISRRKSSK